MRLLACLLALLLPACVSGGSLSLGTDDDDAVGDDDDAIGDDDDATPEEEPPRYTDCFIEQDFEFLPQNTFEHSVHNFDDEGHNAFTELYLDSDALQSIDWRTFDEQDEIILLQSSRDADGAREQTTRYVREYDGLERQVHAEEYDADDALVRTFEVEYRGDEEQARQTTVFAPDGRIDRLQHWSWSVELLIRLETDIGGDGQINEVVTWTYDDGDQAVSQEMDRDGDGAMDLHRDYEYDEDDNLLRWDLWRIEQGDVVQWSEFGGSCYGD